MAHEPKEWNKGTRRGAGGLHAYVNGFVVTTALDNAKLPKELQDIEIRAYPLKGENGTAQVLLKIKPTKPERPTGGKQAK